MNTRKKFNVVDAFIILCVFVILAVVGVRFFTANQEELTAVQQYVPMHLHISATARRHINTFEEGTRLYFVDGTFAGEVSQVTNQPALIPHWDEYGSFAPSTDIGRVDLTLVIQTRGTVLEHGFFHGGSTHIVPGMEVEVVAHNHVFTGLVTRLEW